MRRPLPRLAALLMGVLLAPLLPLPATAAAPAPADVLLQGAEVIGPHGPYLPPELLEGALEARRLPDGGLGVVPVGQGWFGHRVLPDTLTGIGRFALVQGDPGPGEVSFPCPGDFRVVGHVDVHELVLGDDGVPDVVAADVVHGCEPLGGPRLVTVVRVGSAVPFPHLALEQPVVPRVERGGAGSVDVVVRSVGTGAARLSPLPGSDCPEVLPAGGSCRLSVDVRGEPLDHWGADGQVGVAVHGEGAPATGMLATFSNVQPASPCELEQVGRGTAAVAVRIGGCETGVDELMGVEVQRLRGTTWADVRTHRHPQWDDRTVAPLPTGTDASLRAVMTVRDTSTGETRQVPSAAIRTSTATSALLAVSNEHLFTVARGDVYGAALRAGVHGVDVSPDRRTLAVTTGSGEDATLRVERRDGTLVKEIPLAHHQEGALDPRFSPDGRRVAVSGSLQQAVEVVDVVTGSRQHVGQGAVRGWSADGRDLLLMTGRWQTPSLVWLDTASGRTAPLPGTDGVLSADVSRTGAVVLSRRAGNGQEVVVLERGRPARVVLALPTRGSSAEALRWSPDGRQLAMLRQVRDEWGERVSRGPVVLDVGTGEVTSAGTIDVRQLAWDTTSSEAPSRPSVTVPATTTGPRTLLRWAAADPDDPLGALTSRCRVDGGRWVACAAPWRTPHLGVGRHTVDVEVEDRAGGRSPAGTVTWSVAGSDAYGQQHDFDGDGAADTAGFLDGRWDLPGLPSFSHGTKGDVAVPGDYDGDTRSEAAVYRPSTGTWYVRGQKAFSHGARGDVPVVGDFTGDGRADAAVYRPSTGTWYVRGQKAFSHGARGDVPVVADFTGDGRADAAVYRPSTGSWYVRGVGAVHQGVTLGVPVPADYTGDGRADVATYRRGAWHVVGMPVVQARSLQVVPV